MILLICGIVNKQDKTKTCRYREQTVTRGGRGWREDQMDKEGQLCGDIWRLTFHGK